MNILITGGNGMIGAEITNYLSKKIKFIRLIEIKSQKKYKILFGKR